MRGTFENAHQLADVDVLLDRNDIRARNHDIAHPACAHRENFLEHPVFFRREAGFTGTHDIEDVLEVGTYRARLPAEQRAHRTQEPVSAAFRGGGHGHRQITRLKCCAAGSRTVWIAVRHGGHALSDSRATYGSGMLRRIMILLSSPSISSACASVSRSKPMRGEKTADPRWRKGLSH